MASCQQNSSISKTKLSCSRSTFLIPKTSQQTLRIYELTRQAQPTVRTALAFSLSLSLSLSLTLAFSHTTALPGGVPRAHTAIHTHRPLFGAGRGNSRAAVWRRRRVRAESLAAPSRLLIRRRRRCVRFANDSTRASEGATEH